MIPRYQTPFMRELWSDENRFKTWYIVELAYLEAYLSFHKKSDANLLKMLKNRTNTIDWHKFVRSVQRYEDEVKHDVIAFLHALEDELGKDARLIHIGLTSSDIVDTAFALLLKTSSDQIKKNLKGLIEALFRRAKECQGMLCLGRTHGQAAEPTTFGIKLLGHLCEFLRAYQRLDTATLDISVGKFSGAVGVYAHTDPEVEKKALLSLGLRPETVATQVVARDRHAAFFAMLATLAGSIERLSVSIRLLMHGQIEEVSEAFSAKQKGSSAMPHKKNPIISENLSGLMRLMRSYAMAALENQALWHERDIAHSSVERVIAPDATQVLDFALMRLQHLIENMAIDSKKMKVALSQAGDNLCSQAVMLKLIEKGMMRQQAYEIVQQAAINGGRENFGNALKKANINNFLSDDELKELFIVNDQVHNETRLFKNAEQLMASVMLNP